MNIFINVGAKMYSIIVPIQIKPGYKDQFIEAMIGDAKGSIEKEPGCYRFEVIQDGNNSNRIWLVEVYKDEAAFKEHQDYPHYTKWVETVKDWKVEDGLIGAGLGAYNIWPSDEEWKSVATQTIGKIN